jgi:predicted nucleotidyltransferase
VAHGPNRLRRSFNYPRPTLFSSVFRASCSSILRYVWYRNPFSAARILARVRSSSASRIVIVGDAPAWLARSRATRATVPLPSLPAALACSNRSGSVARAEAREESDVDVYVEFEAGFHPSLGWFDLEEELERLLGRHVDLSRKSLLKPRVRREALRDAVVLYES